LARGAETGAAVKANAYGLGAAKVVPALAAAGCKTFFAALPGEGIEVRKATKTGRLFVLAGLGPATADAYLKHGLIPVLNSLGEIETWQQVATKAGRPLPCALHFDTGMSRLGIEAGEAKRIFTEPGLLDGIDPVLIMSHLACADMPSHRLNGEQKRRFDTIRMMFPEVAASLANSAGVLADAGMACDLTRPGIALYGGQALSSGMGPIAPAVTFEARILQIRNTKKGETVGYGATTTVERDSRVAVAGAGYADGYFRAASGSGVAMRQVCTGAKGAIGGFEARLIGRISMDLTTFDVTDVPEQVLEAAEWIELFGKTIALEDYARAAGTIGYEVLTRIGPRAERVYLGG
jgi:alanine racemase